MAHCSVCNGPHVKGSHKGASAAKATPRVVHAKAGTKVFRSAHASPKGKGMSYQAGPVVLLEDARIGPGAGWDVVDVRQSNGEESAAYSFDLSRTHQ